MSSGASRSPNEDYFNDLSQQPDGRRHSSDSPQERGSTAINAEGGDSWVPRPKRVACVVCRKRKLRCDGNKPSCGTCARLGHDCAYDEVRRKSGPKRGYVKQLEARLQQVETLLKNNEPLEASQRGSSGFGDPLQQTNSFQNVPSISLPGAEDGMLNAASFGASQMNMMPDPTLGLGTAEDFSWEMIGLDLDEPLPLQEVIDEMQQIYFDKIHPSIPMIHRPRYLAAMNLAPHMRPPVCLRYAMWTLACSITSKYFTLQDHFYQRARKYAERDEMKGHGESMITIAHSQCWSLLANYEFKMMYFPRAWMSTGRATRLSQMMGLHRQDGIGLDVKQCLPPPRDWTEREERRRTFWTSFCQDRYASIGTGWPMTIDEKDIMTNLPASEEAFEKSKPQRTLPLSEVMSTEGASTLSPFAGVVLMACLFGRNLTHLHRPDSQDNDHDLNGEFWKRHRALDNILLNTSLSLPTHLRLPAGLHDSNIVFCNMNIHTSTICLHQAAIFKADKNRMPAQISAESKRRCIIAADQITNVMKMISHVDLSTMNPFIAFCLYVAARVFVQYLKSRPEDATVKSSLQFLLSAMQALKNKNPLTESFLVQLDVELEGSGIETLSSATRQSFAVKKAMSDIPLNHDSLRCSPLYEIRQSQSPNAQILGEGADSTSRPLQTANGAPMDLSQLNYANQFSNPSNLPSRSKGLIPTPDFGEGIGNDMDLSPDASDRQNSASGGLHSDHPTPSTASNKGSSHTSFTPPTQPTDSNPHHQHHSHYGNPSSSAGVSPRTAASFFQSAAAFSQFFPTAPDTPGKDGPSASGGAGPGPTTNGGVENPFGMDASWEHYSSSNSGAGGPGGGGGGGTGMTPGATGPGAGGGGTGMSPLNEGQWTQMLEGMGWGSWAQGMEAQR